MDVQVFDPFAIGEVRGSPGLVSHFRSHFGLPKIAALEFSFTERCCGRFHGFDSIGWTEMMLVVSFVVGWLHKSHKNLEKSMDFSFSGGLFRWAPCQSLTSEIPCFSKRQMGGQSKSQLVQDLRLSIWWHVLRVSQAVAIGASNA